MCRAKRSYTGGHIGDHPSIDKSRSQVDDSSGGVHIIELHIGTLGFSAGLGILFVAALIAGYFIFRRMQRRHNTPRGHGADMAAMVASLNNHPWRVPLDVGEAYRNLPIPSAPPFPDYRNFPPRRAYGAPCSRPSHNRFQEVYENEDEQPADDRPNTPVLARGPR